MAVMLAMFGSRIEIMALLVVALIYLVPLVAFCKIVQRLGWHWAMGLLMLVPLVNVIMICVFAWGDPPRRASALTAPAVGPPE